MRCTVCRCSHHFLCVRPSTSGAGSGDAEGGTSCGSLLAGHARQVHRRQPCHVRNLSHPTYQFRDPGPRALPGRRAAVAQSHNADLGLALTRAASGRPTLRHRCGSRDLAHDRHLERWETAPGADAAIPHDEGRRRGGGRLFAVALERGWTIAGCKQVRQLNTALGLVLLKAREIRVVVEFRAAIDELDDALQRGAFLAIHFFELDGQPLAGIAANHGALRA